MDGFPRRCGAIGRVYCFLPEHRRSFCRLFLAAVHVVDFCRMRSCNFGNSDILTLLLALNDSPIWLRRREADAYWLLAFCFVIALVPIIQLVPLPPSCGRNLPGRESVAGTFELLGKRTPWMPISVSPHATWISFLSLIPPMAIFLATVQLGYRERRALA